MLQTPRSLTALFAATITAIAAAPASSQATAPPKISGLVTDAGGRPIDGAKVAATALSGAKPMTQSTHTDADGEFEITTLAPGPHRVVVTAPGHQAVVHKPIATGTTDMRVALAPIPGSLQGTVLDPAGRPVAEAWVHTLPNQDLEGIFGGFTPPITNKTVKSDAQGRFRLVDLAPGTYRIVIRHPEFALASVGDQVVRSDKVTALGVISLERGTKVSGEVRVGGKPTGQVKVTITSMRNAAKPRSAFSSEAVTDERGRFEIDVRVPRGSYQIMAARLTLPNPLLQIADFNKTKREIELKPGQDEISLPVAIEK